MSSKNVVILGTFDGVHLGHQRIIKDAVSYAKRNQLRCFATTFDPHPQQFIFGKNKIKLLTTLEERIAMIKKLGVDEVKVLKFNKRLRELECEEFIEKHIVCELKGAIVFVGYDYSFGKNRCGRVKELRRFGEKYGFIVKMVKPFKTDEAVIKSSFIRELLDNGRFRKALTLLGHPYNLSGRVVKGSGKGRKLGFPTANLLIDTDKLIPVHGVYIGIVWHRPCLVNIGICPTFGINIPSVEVFIPKFHGDLYGKILEIHLFKRLRNEIKFPNSNLLREQVLKDIEDCLNFKF
ncbi:riboflavin biosynthesis protein RibF [candidate division WOR-1 bacterium RIFOXYD2_FULL_36_8]|uniref:Riboflavin biosynthesis protein n=1 Tax=candidate division WOR-1 bacterium RIFOXYB2_FULL_36_35 TaxID=1802578 RepID=A0A1F4S6Y8_UNCSA|nr:MAG: riboflavin biosynthesis protein RibF [candidate division WOR-1 bacterium RIFOXYA2_FULL_36_21]OGC15503.1 MAG: riboflavin biosynthesis protein RibF [candidate division WOR-1 bacterium RIFOXYB2_FULL_36_35]OGC21288.1 MAG: riboflavin biosynthesis protein RibF [candidate division WOR-1 bacterium RIFOXYA12_FULL_36_13]OGC41228.1 MAG: riboflavin biosynthesis protein RibF [candidate division WOR-1 bacterium RIFOXYD2_FULL_36_8]